MCLRATATLSGHFLLLSTMSLLGVTGLRVLGRHLRPCCCLWSKSGDRLRHLTAKAFVLIGPPTELVQVRSLGQREDSRRRQARFGQRADQAPQLGGSLALGGLVFV